ncbi:MAG: hypothetical protein Q8Q12_20605 [bacterium]|nr:hypothetical protein [bacterium]
MDTDSPIVAVQISRCKRVSFLAEALEYKGRRIYYRDITDVAYSSSARYVNAIFTGQSYSVRVRSASETIKIRFSWVPFGTRNDKLGERFAQLCGAVASLIEPVVITKQLESVYAGPGVTRIDAVEITSEGITRPRLLRGPAFLPWHRFAGTTLWDGFVNVHETGRRRPRVFIRVYCEAWNAVLLPRLLTICAQTSRAMAARPEDLRCQRRYALVCHRGQG